jgi:hypothetical protein
MKTTIRVKRLLGLLACVASLGLLHAPQARADMVLLSDTTLVRGASTADLSFITPGAGTITATLLNHSWTSVDPLSALSLMVNSSTGVASYWSATQPATTESFQVGAGTYFAHIMATATGALDIGAYSLNLSFVPSAVPLPASDWMLVIGICVLFGLMRLLSAFHAFEGFRSGATLEG